MVSFCTRATKWQDSGHHKDTHSGGVVLGEDNAASDERVRGQRQVCLVLCTQLLTLNRTLYRELLEARSAQQDNTEKRTVRRQWRLFPARLEASSARKAGAFTRTLKKLSSARQEGDAATSARKRAEALTLALRDLVLSIQVLLASPFVATSGLSAQLTEHYCLSRFRGRRYIKPIAAATLHRTPQNLAIFEPAVSTLKNCANQTVVHQILDRVLSKYDIRLRPNFGGAPLPVGISMYVSSIEKISEMTMDYTITMFFHQTWKDPRLAYYETNLNLTLDYRMFEKLWVPDCYFLNSKDAFVHDSTVENRVFQLHPDGTVRYGIRLTTTTACALDLQNFPLDTQTCKLEVESYGYTVDDVILYWEGNSKAIRGTEQLQIPQFRFLGKTTMSKEVLFYTGSYMRLILKFLVRREITSFLLQIYWPTVLTTIISWMSFWMNYESSAARVTIGLTSMLILNAINSHLRMKLPQVCCIKAIDIYMVTCFFFVFLSLLEYVYINYLFYSRRGSRRQRRRQRRARRAMARYRYQEVLSTVSSRDEVSTEDDESSPFSPMQAGLASPDSLSSLVSILKQAPLATAESLSSLSSLSDQSWVAAGGSLSDLPSASEQALPSYSRRADDEGLIPTEIRNRSEGHSRTETCDPEEPVLDEARGPRARHPLASSQRRARSASLDLEEIRASLEELHSLPDDVRVESGYSDLEKEFERVVDTTCSLQDDFVGFDEDKEDKGSNSESDDSGPPSPKCSFRKSFSSKVFHPRYIPKIDKCSRVLFPLAFLVFNIIYWAYHLC
ncbi:PREDICTED: gamma-aminobutyric acid receptor subunit theta [Condylura cristata]|uniref:gamma-aminobutyric acid receptor subunit theta n=1 Tax=Condylura cristata TaxID=143302 RepID=UPI000643BB5A|nr:PREDICTED: gamma-aminobutyric acid receptor subunit theta [Condylura cristata]